MVGQRAACFLISSLAILLPTSGRAEVKRLQYPTTDQAILNPERGFYRFGDLTTPGSFSQVRSRGQTIAYGRVIASEFRDRPLSEAFLARIQAGFDEARREGIKVKFRLAYNDGFVADAPKSVILGHIQQLQPLWERNKDVMFHMDAGFIGAWGEWHSSTNGLETPENRAEILHAILAALPSDRMVAVRTSHFKREIFNGSPVSDAHVVNEQNAFDGSDLSRTGFHNDCFLSSVDDVGTYINPGNKWPLSRELDYIGGESRYVPFGGETCGLDRRSLSANALAEMARLHIDYLHLNYHPDVIARWKQEGSFAEIERRLGYRFQLAEARVSDGVRPGSLLNFGLTIDNVGFGELFNPRPVEIVLRNNATGEIQSTQLDVDPRRWTGGETNALDTWLGIPSQLPNGVYSIGLRLPDNESSLRDDVRYAIRFANENVWDEATGINWLMRDLRIDGAIAGTLYRDLESFRQVRDPHALPQQGDLNNDGVCDTADIDELQAALRGGSQLPKYDLQGDGRIDAEDRRYWVEVIKQTYWGDANLDGLWNSADLVAVFQAGQYEQDGAEATWSTGDWDGDGRFTTSDLVAAFQTGAYEQGPRTAVIAVPETMSCGTLISVISGLGFWLRPRSRWTAPISVSRS